MADNETSYLPIGTCLEQIEKAVYGREVRKAIHDGIAQCYDDTVEGVNAAQQAASDTQEVIDNAVAATNAANTAATEASNVKVEQTVSGDTVTFTTTKRDGTTVSTSFQRPNIVVSKDEGSGEFSVTATGWNGSEIVATIPDPSEEVKSRATIAAVSKVKTALGNPLTITDGMDAPAVKTVVTLEPKQDLHGYDHPWVGGSGKNLLPLPFPSAQQGTTGGLNVVYKDGKFTINGTTDASGGEFIVQLTEPINFDPTKYKLYLKSNDQTFGAYLRTYTNSSYTHEIVLRPANRVFSNWTTQTGDDSVVSVGIKALNEVGTVVSNIVLEPMLLPLDAEIPDTYEPYSNICPIEGYDTVRVTATGKNLLPCTLNNKTVNNVVFKKQSDGSYLLDGVASANIGAERFYIGDGYFLKPNTKYVLSGSPDGGGSSTYRLMAGFNDATITFTDTGNGVAFTTPSSWTNFMVYPIVLKDQNMAGKVFAPMIRLATEENSTYEPFGNTLFLNLVSSTGSTVYGGTVTLNEDGSGTLVVDKQYLKGSECTWSVNASNANTFNGQHTYALSVANDTTGYSSAYVMYNSNEVAKHDYGFAHANAGRTLYVKDKDYSDLASFQTHIADVEFVYNLATPSNPINLTASQLRTLTGENHVWTDGTKLELTYRADKYADVEKFLNAIPTGTKTGDPAVFADGADDLPFEKLTIAVEPHQEGSGDPSPDNVRPITGWDEVKVTRCGKNFFQPIETAKTISGVTVETTENGEIWVHGTPTINSGLIYFELPTLSQELIGKTVTLSINKKVVGVGVDPNIGGGALTLAMSETATKKTSTINTISGAARINVRYDVGAINEKFKVQIEIGTTATEFEPYQGFTLPISLKYATGSTVYGGTVTINRDGTGSVVVDRAVTTLADKTFGNKQSSSLAAGGYISVTGFADWIDTSAAPKSDMLVGTTFDNRGADGVISPPSAASSDKSFAIFTAKTRDDAVTAYKNATVCYKLATPITYTLTAPQLTTLLGNNTVWCDAGQVTVKYKMDIGKALDAMKASLIEAGLYVDMGGVTVEPGA